MHGREPQLFLILERFPISQQFFDSVHISDHAISFLLELLDFIKHLVKRLHLLPLSSEVLVQLSEIIWKSSLLLLCVAQESIDVLLV